MSPIRKFTPPVMIAALLMTSVGVPPAAAKEEAAPPDNTYIVALRKCQAIKEDSERLACYDKAASSLVAANDSGDLKVVDREDVHKARRGLFGFSLPVLNIFGKGGKDQADQDEMNQIETTVKSARRTRYGNIIVTTAENAVWEIYEVPQRLMMPRPGDSLVIKKGALTAYFLRIDGQKGVKARRIG